jgi:hypothetical protein
LRKHRTRFHPLPPPHLALRFDARKDADVVQQGRRAASALQHFKGGTSDGQFEGTRLKVRTVLWGRVFAPQLIRRVRCMRRIHSPSLHRKPTLTLSINSVVVSGVAATPLLAVISDQTTAPCLLSYSPSIRGTPGGTMPHARAM